MEDVDDWDSFKKFETGWILPPEQKRHGRPYVERGPVPPPRKRMRRCEWSGVLYEEMASSDLRLRGYSA